MRGLCASIGNPEVRNCTSGEHWMACDVDTSPVHQPFLFQVTVASESATEMAREAAAAGVRIEDPAEFRAVITITISGEADWPPIRTVLQTGMQRWKGILFDETSGFNATLD